MTLHAEEYAPFSERVFTASAEAAQPLRVQFEITYRCNIHCVHCYTDPFNNASDIRREMSFEEILNLLDQMATAGVLWLTLTGGEAFVHPRFKEIYAAARARGFIIALYSNGTTVTDELAEFLAKDPPFKLELSLHGASAQTFDQVVQVPGLYPRFLEGVRKLLDRHLPVKIKTKAMTLNRAELPELRARVESWGLDFNVYTTIYPRLNGDLSSTQYRLSTPELIELESEHLQETSEACEVAGTDAAPPDDRLFRCGCGTNTATVNPYGRIRPCTFTTQPSYSLREMTFQEGFRRLVDDIRASRYTENTPCRTCPAYTFCEKNPAMALYEAGSVQAPVPAFCETAFARQEKVTVLRGQPR